MTQAQANPCADPRPAVRRGVMEHHSGAQLVSVEGAGHFTITERPDSVASALEDWIDQSL